MVKILKNTCIQRYFYPSVLYICNFIYIPLQIFQTGKMPFHLFSINPRYRMHFSDCQFEITASFITFHNPERFESIFCHGSTTPICLQDRNHNWMIAILHKFFYVSNLILFFLHSNFFIDSHMAFCKFFQSSVINIFDHSSLTSFWTF